jgi:hypothetical protein
MVSVELGHGSIVSAATGKPYKHTYPLNTTALAGVSAGEVELELMVSQCSIYSAHITFILVIGRIGCRHLNVFDSLLFENITTTFANNIRDALHKLYEWLLYRPESPSQTRQDFPWLDCFLQC